MRRKHGMAQTRTYKSWNMMRHRCLFPNAINYHAYGGRGIKVCERWLSFENFLADMGERPDGTSLDRVNNDGNYEPSNCRWATLEQQLANKHYKSEVLPALTFNGITATPLEWSVIFGIRYRTIRSRLKKGFPVDKILSKQTLSINKLPLAIGSKPLQK